MSGSIAGAAALVFSASLTAFFQSPPAKAAEPGRAEFAAGDFDAARRIAHDAGSGEALALACQAGLIIGGYLETGEPAVVSLHDAISDCANSIKSRANRPDAYINYAIGISFEAKRLHSRSDAALAKNLMEAAIERFPNSGFAHTALATWNAEVSNRSFFARALLGASEDRAQREFALALTLDGDNYAINYQWFRYLAAHGRKNHAEAEAAAMRLLEELQPKDQFEKLLRERARIIADALALDDTGKIDEALKATEPFRDIENVAADEKYSLSLTVFPPPEPIAEQETAHE